jgi:iron complex outermembrane receptor protein
MKPRQLAAVAFFFASAAYAQQEPQRGERIEVTGSSIKRIDAETALPVQILRREDIERIGATTTEELLKYVTAATSAGSIQASQANGTVTTSQSTVSLRALGSTRTLILVNGRRTAVFGGTTSTAVDVNSIPISALDRIEVLKDGASSLYGSDAIAGVVNFILRRDYVGAEARAMYGAPTRSGGGNSWEVSAFAGFGEIAKDRYNVTLGAGYAKIDPILGADRPFARNINVGERNDLSSTISFPGNILYGPTFGRLSSPAFPDCGPTSIVSPFFIGNVNSGTACRFENSPFLSVQSGSEKTHVLLNLRYALSSAAEAYFESGFTRNRFSFTTQPVPISEGTSLTPANPYNAFLANLIATRYPTLPAALRRLSTQGNTLVLLPPGSPFYPTAFVASRGLPTNQPIAFRYRDFANGIRHTQDSADNIRVVAGLKGTLAGWDYDSAFLYSQSKAASNLQTGYPLYSRFLPILDSGAVNPFGPTTDPATLAAVQAAEFRGDIYTSKTSTTSLDAKASREVLQMRGGPLGLAVGGEIREERFVFSPSLSYQMGDIAGFGGNILPVDRKRHVASVYSEIAVPVLKNFEADVGIRYDNYQVVGSTTNPKLSLRFQPSNELLLRASVGSGFRAPSLTELYTAQATSVTANGTRDPIRCPNPAVGLPADCNNQFRTITGGNETLKPEKSISATFGVLFEPTRDLSIGVDAYWIRLKDSIIGGGLNYAFILQNAQNATQYSSFIRRGAPDGNASGMGPIIGVVQTTSNLFRVKVSGYDIDIKFRPLNTASQKVLLRLDGSYVRQFKRELADGSWSNSVDLALTASGGVIPAWRHVATLAYENGPWAASLLQNFQKSYHDLTGTFATAPRVVSSYETYDAQVVFKGIRNVRLTLGAKNLFDRDPPYTNAGGQFAAGYDITYADVRGRFVYASAGITFR